MNKFNLPSPQVSTSEPIESNSQYRRVLKKLMRVTQDLKVTREYLSDKLYPLTGGLNRESVVQKPSEIKEVLVPLANELDEIYIELDDINEHINFILNNVEL